MTTKLRTYTVQALSVMTQLKAAGFSSDAVYNDHTREWKWILTKDGARYKGESGNARQGGLEPYEVAFWGAVEQAERMGAVDVKEKTGR